jgi:serine/threonine protein phosphatase 1
MTKTFVIGDIHGCYAELMGLMKKLPLDYNKDIVVFLGDYVDRGPDSKKVINQLMKWQKKYPHWVFLMGNHEHMMIDYFLNKGQYDTGIWMYNGGDNTMESFGNIHSNVTTEIIEWLSNLQKYYEDEEYFYCHAGLLPSMTLEENKQLPLRTFLWIREEFLNVDHDFGKFVIVGHTPNREAIGTPIVKKHFIGIDGAVCPWSSKNLLAIELPKRIIYFEPSHLKVDNMIKLLKYVI